MAEIYSKLYEIYSLEQLSGGETNIHNIHPIVKMTATFFYIACVLSFDRYSLAGLVPYVFYPAIVIALAEIPYGMILSRALLALPFCILAGLSNVFYDRGIIANIGDIAISYGAVSFAVLILRTFLCVSAVLILIAVTPLSELTAILRKLHIPEIFVSLLEMTYRYIGTLLEEASTMYTAYRLRSRNRRGLLMKDMGSFVGALLIRSFDRAERVYIAMKCRGYPAGAQKIKDKAISKGDIFFLIAVLGPALLFRAVDIPGMISMCIGGLL